MFRSSILTLLLLCSLHTPLLADINSANAALARGDYAGASQEFERLANEGNAKAQTHLGYMYYVGEGVEQNYAEAVNWYRKAAVQGDKDAQYNLAVAYAFGEGTTQDYKEAAIWYRRAAEQGHEIAQYSLGLSYSYGEGVKQDSSEAVKWFEKSAEQGYARAQVQLASKYHTGDGVSLDHEKAVKWYRMAADRGNAAAQYNLGSMFRAGKGVPQDYNQALRWYRLAADQGYAAATNELSSLERAIAGAARNNKKPVLQPTPVAKAAPKPKKEPLVTVETSDLLTLDNEEDDPLEQELFPEDDNTGEDMNEDLNESIAATEDNAMSMSEEEEEKKPGRVSGFFKNIFGKKDKEVEESSEPESSEEMESMADADAPSDAEVVVENALLEESVPVEDLSESVPESMEEIDAEHEVVYNEPEEKKSRFGFFKKLFGNKDPSEEVEVEDQSTELTDSGMASKDDIEVIADAGSSTDAEATSDEKRNWATTTDWPVSDSSSEQSDEMDALERDLAGDTETVEEAPEEKKKGFFGRLFGKKDKAEEVMDDSMEESSMASEDTVAMVDDGNESIPVLEDEIEIDSSAEEQATMDALAEEEQAEGKKKGFFGRLFGKKDKAEEVMDDSMEESSMASEDTVAMVDDGSESIPVLEDEIEIDSSAEEQAAMDALAEEEQPKEKKKGFFKRLFGKSADKSDDDVIDSSDDLFDEEEVADEEVMEAIEVTEPEFVAEPDVLEAAYTSLDNGVFEEAFSQFEDLAVQGDTTAQYELGRLYYQGLGVAQNYNEASHWYSRAGHQGSADAQYSLGNMFLMGEGISQDDSKAIAWYEKAAEQGHVAAKHNVDNLRRVTKNQSSSTEEIEKALANEQVDVELADGEVAEEEPKKGFFGKLFGSKDSDEEAEPEAAAEVQGPLPQIQPEDEVAEAEPLAEVEEEKKKGFFGRLFGKDDDETEEEIMDTPSDTASVDTSIIGEPEQSFEDTIAAVESYEKGLAFSFGDGVAQDNEAAFNAFKTAAELGHLQAQYKTGVAYAYGEGVTKDPQQALYWYEKAAKRGNALAQRNLGIIYMSGDGVEQNKALGFAWHSIVAESGNVMDVHRRDALRQQLSEAEVSEAMALKDSLTR